MNRSLGAVCFALAACEPSETAVNRVYPDMVVTPSVVDFGDVAVYYSQGVGVTVINAGLAALEIESVTIEDSGVFAVDVAGPIVLKADEAAVLGVTFAPDTYLPFAADLVIRSNDEEHPELVIPLSGTGVYAPTPEITVTPQSLEFGTVVVGDVGYLVLGIANDGGSTLSIESAEQHGSSAFALQGADPSGFSIAPEQLQQLVWTYTPALDVGDNGTYVITSNDPDEPVVTVTLLGNGGGDFEYPEAVIDCPTTIEPRKVVPLDGSASTDPEGLPLTYAWTLDGTPLGSDVAGLIDDTQAISHFTTDVAGEYTVSLIVTNTNGIESAKRTCTMDAIPIEQLHVELSWSTNSADLDLHLVNDGLTATCEDGADNDLDGAEDCDVVDRDSDGIDDGPCVTEPSCHEGVSQGFFSSPVDCNFCSGSVDWGVILDPTDDPSLDIDDRSGYGPENTNIDDPAESTYRVLVHYFDDHGDGDTVATVRVYVKGALVSEETRTIARNYLWEVGQVNWPEGTFGLLDVYHENVVSDAAGEPVLDSRGRTVSGPYECYGE